MTRLLISGGITVAQSRQSQYRLRCLFQGSLHSAEQVRPELSEYGRQRIDSIDNPRIIIDSIYTLLHTPLQPYSLKASRFWRSEFGSPHCRILSNTCSTTCIFDPTFLTWPSGIIVTCQLRSMSPITQILRTLVIASITGRGCRIVCSSSTPRPFLLNVVIGT